MTRRRWERYATGGLLILIGVFLLLWTTDIIDAATVWAWIPALFVLLGMWALLRSGFRNFVGPVMIIAIAGAFFLRAIGIIEEGVISMWWPLFIVLFGILVILNRSHRRSRIVVDSKGGVDAVAVFSTIDRRVEADAFGEAEVAAVFGDVRLDLRDTTIPHPPAIIDVASIFGDAEIRVPEKYVVTFEVMSVFGDVSDRRPRRSEESPGEADVIISGIALFGDISVLD